MLNSSKTVRKTIIICLLRTVFCSCISAPAVSEDGKIYFTVVKGYIVLAPRTQRYSLTITPKASAITSMSIILALTRRRVSTSTDSTGIAAAVSEDGKIYFTVVKGYIVLAPRTVKHTTV